MNNKIKGIFKNKNDNYPDDFRVLEQNFNTKSEADLDKEWLEGLDDFFKELDENYKIHGESVVFDD